MELILLAEETIHQYCPNSLRRIITEEYDGVIKSAQVVPLGGLEIEFSPPSSSGVQCI